MLRRLLVAAASGGTGFLLLAALGHAAAHPATAADSFVRLLWCAVPVAATIQLAVSAARTDPACRPQRGMSAAGLGPVRLTVIAATSTAVSCVLGSFVALLAFLMVRGDLVDATAADSAAQLLGAGHSLPLAGALMLLAVVPVTAATATAVVLRPRRNARGAGRRTGASAGAGAGEPLTAMDTHSTASAVPAALPWGMALTAAGLALETYVSRGPANADTLLPLPGRLIGSPPGVLAGWALSTLGLVLAGPGLARLSGRLLAAGRPGAIRLLAGRVLQEESRRIGRPLGVLCAVASGAYAAVKVYEAAPTRPFGPLTGLGAALVLACVTASALTAALEARWARTHTTAALRRLGTPRSVLFRASVLRVLALLVVLGPLTWAIAELAALPLLH
ncbi:membrane protein [Streptomyces rimosus subsp. rimosus]|nr:membrane protein [Streptomyces sp. NRRL WC-3701]KOT38975.1 membrane protein [Streptomyces rimosus subsp. rimosus]KOT62728.1 membrane protein [Streptomyces rimosus subsp. rimosus]KOT71330.1 membrane protein [Streptomyces rimosus subsp. rimosus]KOT78527.1 membrane protein [Streptomyces rimosus subsp. rimosus]